jgi:hypothetical protein
VRQRVAAFRRVRCVSLQSDRNLFQREDHLCPTEIRIIGQRRGQPHGAQSLGSFGETLGRIADNTGRRVELIRGLACGLAGGLEPSVQRSVEKHAAIGGPGAAIS